MRKLTLKALFKPLLLAAALLLSVTVQEAAIPAGFSLPAPAYAPRQNSDTTGTNTIWALWGTAPSLTSTNFQFNGFISLSAVTNRLTIATNSLLLDGIPIGGVNSYVSNLFVTNLTVNNITVQSNAYVSNLFVNEVIVTNNITVNGNNKSSNVFTFNITVTNVATFLSNVYVSNLFALFETVTNSLTVYSNTYTSNLFAFNITVTNNANFASNVFVSNLFVTNFSGTIDGTLTNTVLKSYKSIRFQFPRRVDGVGCTIPNTNDFTAFNFMVPRFSATAATNANFAKFATIVPWDLDTSQDLQANLKVVLVSGDTSASTYTLGMVSVSDSADWETAAANYVTLTIPSDAGGGAGNVESVYNVTLTNWKANLTPNDWWVIQLNRDGNDASATAEDFVEVEIRYVSKQ